VLLHSELTWNRQRQI